MKSLITLLVTLVTVIMMASCSSSSSTPEMKSIGFTKGVVTSTQVNVMFVDTTEDGIVDIKCYNPASFVDNNKNRAIFIGRPVDVEIFADSCKSVYSYKAYLRD